MENRLFCALVVLVLAVSGYVELSQAADVTATWNGTGLWSDVANWSSPEVPNNGALTYDVVISSGTVTSDVVGVTVDGLDLTGGLIGGTENITVLDSGSWTRERIFNSGGLTFDSSSTFAISGSNPKSLDNQTSLTVRGTLTFAGTGVLRAVDSAAAGVSISVESEGIFDIQSDADIIGEFGAGLKRKGTLTNAGTLKKSAGSGLSVIDGNWDVTNTGNILVQSGSLQFSNFNFGNFFNNEGTATSQAGKLIIGRGVSTGAFDVMPDAELRVKTNISGTQVFDGATVTNDGDFVLEGNAEFTNSATYSGAGKFEILSGTLTGDVGLSLPDFSWLGGSINSTGTITVPSEATATISGSDIKRLGSNTSLVINGNANVTSTNDVDTFATAVSPAQVTVAAGGVLDFQSDAGFSDGQSGFNTSRAGNLTIDGTLQKSAGTESTFTQNWTIVNNGVVDVQTGTVNFEGAVSGAGNYGGTGAVTFDNDYSPSDSTSTIEFAGNVNFDNNATLFIEVGGETSGSDFDALDIAGAISLDGELQVSLVNSFEPELGDSFEIINAEQGISGQFDVENLPSLTEDLLGWSVLYETNTVTLEVIPLVFDEADFNEDTFVDGNDLSAWASNFALSSEASKSQGDADEDGDVDGADFLIWQRQHTGAPPSESPAVSAVPEPGSCSIVCLAVVLASTTRSTQRGKGRIFL